MVLNQRLVEMNFNYLKMEELEMETKSRIFIGLVCVVLVFLGASATAVVNDYTAYWAADGDNTDSSANA